MPTLDKELYWKRRKDGKRGQGEYPSKWGQIIAIGGTFLKIKEDDETKNKRNN